MNAHTRLVNSGHDLFQRRREEADGNHVNGQLLGPGGPLSRSRAGVTADVRGGPPGAQVVSTSLAGCCFMPQVGTSQLFPGLLTWGPVTQIG